VTDSATFTTPEAGDEDLGDLLLEALALREDHKIRCSMYSKQS